MKPTSKVVHQAWLPPAKVDLGKLRAHRNRWQEKLIDLSRSNPLLNLEGSRMTRLQVTKPGAAHLFDDLYEAGQGLRFPHIHRVPGRSKERFQGNPVEDEAEVEYQVRPGDLELGGTPGELFRKIRRIHDNARLTLEERGITTLYITFGTLRWRDERLGDCTSPLCLIPCQFEKLDLDKPLRLFQADQEVCFNPALEYYLRDCRNARLPELPEPLSGALLEAYFEAVRSAVRDREWTVDDQVWLATFTYSSLQLYEDLKSASDEALAANEVICALSHSAPPPQHSDVLGEDRLDDPALQEEVPFPLLEADSSQLKALTIAGRQRHLVVHGPPGTGKSQTISNLIADALGKGRTVLFVSAKMAALNVVYERLAKIGLGRFCLEVHSTKAGKAQIIGELKATLESGGGAAQGALGEGLAQLQRTRGQLNQYVKELHQPQGMLKLSLYQVLGRFERLRNLPGVKGALPWASPLDVGADRLQDAFDALSALAALHEIFDTRQLHPWRGFSPNAGTSVTWEDLEAPLHGVRKFLETLLGHLKVLQPFLGEKLTQLPLTRLLAMGNCLEALGSSGVVPKNWHCIPVQRLRDARATADKCVVRIRKSTALLEEHHRKMSLDVPSSISLLDPVRTEFRSWIRVFRPAYWSWRGRVREVWNSDCPFSHGAVTRCLADAQEIIEHDAWVGERGPDLSEFISVAGVRDIRPYAVAAGALKAAAMVRQALESDQLPIPASPAPWTEVLGVCAREAAALLGNPDFSHSLDALDALWREGLEPPHLSRELSIGALLKRLEEIAAAPVKVHEWMSFQAVLKRCDSMGLRPFLESLDGVSARLSKEVFERRFLGSWSGSLIQNSATLAPFIGDTREQLIHRFRELDKRVRQEVLSETISRASQKAFLIRENRFGAASPGELGILRRELQKKRRIKPLRKLFAEIPHALQALKPCMLMSPLSVATFLAKDAVTFDVVVFDEASQLPTPDAIPAILRARQVVVAGDENQLPPTTYFHGTVTTEEEDDESEALNPLESLLNDCVAVEPTFERSHLRWHYRSRDERLIGFSNHYFYENRLITFPSVDPSAADVGVRVEHVHDGVWDRGRSKTNRAEANRMVEIILDQLSRLPNRSLGVVAMNVTQGELIGDLLDQAMEDHPQLVPLLAEDRKEPFFIKSLENVQGDERDTILISVGYGKGADGALSYNFGPLNRDGGWRRLNVLVTRAKWQIILVTSLQSRELDGVNPGNRGACALKDFIAYAEQGGKLPPAAAVLTGAESNDFEDSIAEALRDHGLMIDAQVGVSSFRIDLAVRDPRNPQRYVLGIECDGATYHSARTARDRDLLRQDVLRGHGWKIHRIWSTDWFKDRDAALQRALKAVERAVQLPAHESVQAPPILVQNPGDAGRASSPVPEVQVSRQYAVGQPYRRFQDPRRRSGRQYLMEENYSRALADQMGDLVAIEGPIHEELLIDRLKQIHGVARLGTKVENNILLGIHRAEQSKRLERNGRFLKVPGSTLQTFRTPGDEVQRILRHISPDELRLAILHVVESSFGCQKGELARAVGDLFGAERVTSEAEDAIVTEIEGLIDSGRLRVSGPNVNLA